MKFLHSSEKHENDDDDECEAHTSRRDILPSVLVREPCDNVGRSGTRIFRVVQAKAWILLLASVFRFPHEPHFRRYRTAYLSV